jgi:CubicO group peptidase (beta-lactamase class C family)
VNRAQTRAIARLMAAAQREVDEGRTPACQLALALHGELIAVRGFGAATDTTRFAAMSCTKALVAATMVALISERALSAEMRVVDVFPEFGTNGKHAVTVEHLVVHTAGFPHAPMGPEHWQARGRRIEKMATWRLQWPPGSRCSYHATSAHWVLAELIERLGGQDFRDHIHSRVTEPLGLSKIVGIDQSDPHDIADIVLVYDTTPADDRTVGKLPREITPEVLQLYNEPAVRAVGVPATGGFCTAADLALLYQALLHDQLGLWDPQALADITTNIRCTRHDEALGVPVNRSLGLMVAGTGDANASAVRGFGSANSARAFGHGGLGGQIAWADPETGLSFCYLAAGIGTDFAARARRASALSDLATACAQGLS